VFILLVRRVIAPSPYRRRPIGGIDNATEFKRRIS